MVRKRWTAQTNIDDSLLQFREKRKWQIALRRYVLEKNKSSFYAPYFGLDNEKFREWIEIQFTKELSWENFSSHWQFDHIVPVAYFDFTKEEDMRLCWNFINIQVEKNTQTKDRKNRIDVLAAKKYFEVLYRETGFAVCKGMIDKITQIEASEIPANTFLHDFIRQNKDYLATVKDFTPGDFDRLNTGTPLQTLLFEKDFIKRIG